MALIKKTNGLRLTPGASNKFFRLNQTEWEHLKAGNAVEIPDEDLEYHMGYFGASIEVLEHTQAVELSDEDIEALADDEEGTE